ncbi:uncharacterized protein [Montipora foliosa]|uniref:uncharacterized protein isoform X1 n=1 Tax=Montipora foliosa TaxID=591990 RepID=UPI0035F1F696
MAWSAPEDWSRWDPEKLLVCPYDEVHLIKAKRFQHHLLKCRKNHPDKDFVSCPFNAKHVMSRSEVRHHVSRCPDRSVIEQYNYKGSEKDDDGFYFKGNTSVPGHYYSEDLQNASENWDDEEDNLKWTGHSGSVPSCHQRVAQSFSPSVTDSPSLSSEDRERLKRQMRSEAVLRGANSRMLLTSEGASAHSDISNVTSHAGNLAQIPTQETVSSLRPPPKSNPVFEHCIGKMQKLSLDRMKESFKEQRIQDDARNKLVPMHGRNENHNGTTVYCSTPSRIDLRVGNTESQMARLTLGTARNDPESLEVSRAQGQPASLGSAGISSPHFCGVGRAKLAAEARKNNFGGISFSPPKVAGTEAARAKPSYGRGRGVLNWSP